VEIAEENTASSIKNKKAKKAVVEEIFVPVCISYVKTSKLNLNY
jgi:hypothetical protein